MVRRFDSTEKEKSKISLLGYWLAVILIILAWVAGFKLYFERYDYLHPDITWAVPGKKTEIIKVPGLLLWRENEIKAPLDGTIKYPHGKGPIPLAKGQIVAIINNGGTETPIKTTISGFFMVGTDGQEDTWRYGELWSGKGPLTEPSQLKTKSDGEKVTKNETIGKIIKQPQEIRFVGYITPKGNFMKQLKNKQINVMMDTKDTVSKAELRIYKKTKDKIKIYVTLPWFSKELLQSRKYTLIIEAGGQNGAVVPRTAVKEEKGKHYVYFVKGQRLVKNKIECKPIENEKMLITHGLSVGDAVAENASETKEGRIQLW
ncbi:MAG: HlyD family efflux transporter periplasmic adaptor subunit [Synergistaceae bacterium]